MENGCPIGEYTCEAAAMKGNMKCLKYLVEKGAFIGFATSSAAGTFFFSPFFPFFPVFSCLYAVFNKFDCVKYLLENGAPKDETVCNAAARNGRLEILKYVKEKGCPWGYYLFLFLSLFLFSHFLG